MDEQTEEANTGGHRLVGPPTNFCHYSLQHSYTQVTCAAATLEAKQQSQGVRNLTGRQTGCHNHFEKAHKAQL